MLRAAATFLSLLLIWFIATQRFSSVADLAVAAVVVLSAVLLGGRFGGGLSASFSRAPRLLLLGLSRGKTVLEGAAATTRAALAADIKLSPGLARLKTRGNDASARADLAALISATPGSVVVDADAEGLLIHLINESDAESGDLSGLEARVLGAHGAKVQA